MKFKFHLIATMALFALSACSSIPDKISPVEKPQEVATAFSLNWENTTEAHPERKPWSAQIKKSLGVSRADIEKASDLTSFCPKYFSLSAADREKALGELIVGMAYYESGYKPETIYRECSKTKCQYGGGCRVHETYGYCMKGGDPLENGLVVSRGLLQLSLLSSKGYKCDVSKPEHLNDPIKNLACGVNILQRQVIRTGKITGASNYWAVIKGSYTNNKISEIQARVKKHAPKCN